MIGMYTEDELFAMKGIVSSAKMMYDGYVVRKIGSTYNYYRKESDGSWTNYNCKTVY